MTLKVGDYLKVKTKTLKDVFGTCIYRVEEVGLTLKDSDENNGVKCRMLGGSGPSARRGICITEPLTVIQQNIKDGITEVIPEDQAKKLEDYYEEQAKTPGRSGVMEW
jgi:hypothetical protein